MKAVILNSGLGKRMADLTKNLPKCMVEIAAGKTIIFQQLDILKKLGIKDFLITTGPFHDLLKSHIALHFPNLNVEYVHNPLYSETNYIYSLYLAKEKLDNDIILLHGDMVIDENICNRVLNSPQKNLVVMDKSAPLPEKDFKGIISGNNIQKISINLSGDNCYFLLPFYKMHKNKFALWMNEIERFVKGANTSVYAENAFNEISSSMELEPLWLEREICMEVDNPEDLKRAQRLLGT